MNRMKMLVVAAISVAGLGTLGATTSCLSNCAMAATVTAGQTAPVDAGSTAGDAVVTRALWRPTEAAALTYAVASPIGQAAPPVPVLKPDPSGDILVGARIAFANGGWIAVLGFGLAALFTRLTRRMVTKAWAWIGTRWGGYAWALVSAVGVTVGVALSIGTPFSWGVLGTAFAVALTSIGTHQFGKDAAPAAPA